MHLWVLNCKDGTSPPGTTRLIDSDPDSPNGDLQERKLRHTIVLDPPLTRDPDDPLNWPRWQREVAFAILCLCSVVSVAGSAVLGPAFAPLAASFKIPIGHAVIFVGYRDLTTAVTAALIIPFASIWGKRLQYLLGISLVFEGLTWSGQALSSGSFLGSQIMQGVGNTSFFALIGLSIGDLYHVHQRGSRMAIATVTLFASGYGPPIIAGIVVQNLGWRWIFHILALISGLALVLLILFHPETAYSRQGPLLLCNPHDIRNSEDLRSHNSKSEETINTCAEELICQSRMSFARRLLPMQLGKISRQDLFNLWIRPYIFVLHPVVLWFILNASIPLVGLYVMSTYIAVYFPGHPLYFRPSQIGLMNLAPAAGTVYSLVLCAGLSDRLAKFLAKMNNGIYEPEFRLPLAISPLVTGFLGAYGFGVTATDIEKYGWFWPAFFFAFQIAGLVTSTMIGSAYIVDGYPNIAAGTFTSFTVVKFIFSFFGAIDTVKWVEQAGLRKLLTVLAFIQLGLCISTLPLYIFGKRIRSRSSRIAIFQRSHV